jgi:large subunit ribosomal protein L15
VLKGKMDPIHSLQSAGPVSETAGAEAAEKEARAVYPYRAPDPTSRKDIEYYRDPAHRGYLSHSVGSGESPSLFFRVPTAMGGKKKTVQKKKTSAAAENRIW